MSSQTETPAISANKLTLAELEDRLRGRAGPFTAQPGERYVDAEIAMQVLRDAVASLFAQLDALRAAVQPFVRHNSGDETTTITVKSDDIRALRHAMRESAELEAQTPSALAEKLRSCEQALAAAEAERDALGARVDELEIALRDEASLTSVWRRRCERLDGEAAKYQWVRARMDAGMVSMIVNIEPDDNDETSLQVDLAIASAIAAARAESGNAKGGAA